MKEYILVETSTSSNMVYVEVWCYPLHLPINIIISEMKYYINLYFDKIKEYDT